MGRTGDLALTVCVLTGAHEAADLAPWADLVLESIVGRKPALGEYRGDVPAGRRRIRAGGRPGIA